jgi:hypothetical protein
VAQSDHAAWRIRVDAHGGHMPPVFQLRQAEPVRHTVNEGLHSGGSASFTRGDVLRV